MELDDGKTFVKLTVFDVFFFIIHDLLPALWCKTRPVTDRTKIQVLPHRFIEVVLRNFLVELAFSISADKR